MQRDLKEVINYLWQHHAAPWNFCLHAIVVCILSTGMWKHEPVYIAIGIILFAGSLFTLPLPPMEQAGLGWLKNMIAALTEVERFFWTRICERRPWLRIVVVIFFTSATGFALWQNDIPMLLFVGLGLYLLKILSDNIQNGIKP